MLIYIVELVNNISHNNILEILNYIILLNWMYIF